MLNQDILIEILSYLTRDQLEHLSPVCRFLHSIVENYFCSSPYRVIDGYLNLTQNDDGDLEICLWKHAAEEENYWNCLDFNPISRHWDNYTMMRTQPIVNYPYSIFKPFLNQTVRITHNYIAIYSTPYKNEDVEAMEQLAVVWTDFYLELCRDDLILYDSDTNHMVLESLSKFF